jgi:hypothetical protein
MESRAGHVADDGQDAIIDDVAMAWIDGKRLEPPSVIGRRNCFGVVGPKRATQQSVHPRAVASSSFLSTDLLMGCRSRR